MPPARHKIKAVFWYFKKPSFASLTLNASSANTPFLPYKSEYEAPVLPVSEKYKSQRWLESNSVASAHKKDAAALTQQFWSLAVVSAAMLELRKIL
jgi:hypothetical protein